jgi:outer membrane lipoprotein-sorting protein
LKTVYFFIILLNIGLSSPLVESLLSVYKANFLKFSTLQADVSTELISDVHNQTQTGMIYIKQPNMRLDYTAPEQIITITKGENVFIKNGNASSFTQVPSSDINLSTFSIWSSDFFQGMYIKQTMNDGTIVSFSAYSDPEYKNLVCYGKINIKSALVLELTTFSKMHGANMVSKASFTYQIFSGVVFPVLIDIQVTNSLSSHTYTIKQSFKNIKINIPIDKKLFETG